MAASAIASSSPAGLPDPASLRAAETASSRGLAHSSRSQTGQPASPCARFAALFGELAGARDGGERGRDSSPAKPANKAKPDSPTPMEPPADAPSPAREEGGDTAALTVPVSVAAARPVAPLPVGPPAIFQAVADNEASVAAAGGDESDTSNPLRPSHRFPSLKIDLWQGIPHTGALMNTDMRGKPAPAPGIAPVVRTLASITGVETVVTTTAGAGNGRAQAGKASLHQTQAQTSDTAALPDGKGGAVPAGKQMEDSPAQGPARTGKALSPSLVAPHQPARLNPRRTRMNCRNTRPRLPQGSRRTFPG